MKDPRTILWAFRHFTEGRPSIKYLNWLVYGVYKVQSCNVRLKGEHEYPEGRRAFEGNWVGTRI